MSTKTQSELSKFFGPVVATGAERICVRNLNNEFSCFKISKKIHSWIFLIISAGFSQISVSVL